MFSCLLVAIFLLISGGGVACVFSCLLVAILELSKRGSVVEVECQIRGDDGLTEHLDHCAVVVRLQRAEQIHLF